MRTPTAVRMHPRFRSGRVISWVVGSAAGVAALILGCEVTSRTLPAPVSSPTLLSMSTNPTRTCRAQLSAAGLSAENLCAAGLSAQQSADVAEAGLEYLEEHGTSLAAAQTALTEAAEEVDRLEGLAMRGRATEQDRTDLATARTALASAVSGVASARAALFEAATDGLSGGTKTLIQRFHANRDRTVPLKYRGADRTEAQWVSLRDALSDLEIASRKSEEPASASASLVSTENATEETIRATAALANLAEVRTSWLAAACVGE